MNNESKFYFYDAITALNTTIAQYTYSQLENTTTETNVVTTTLRYTQDSTEPTMYGRALNVLNILNGLYDIFNPLQIEIYNELVKENMSTATAQQVKDFIQANYGQTHPMGTDLENSVILIQQQQYANSTAMTTEMQNVAADVAQRQVLLDQLKNDPTLRYDMAM